MVKNGWKQDDTVDKYFISCITTLHKSSALISSTYLGWLC